MAVFRHNHWRFLNADQSSTPITRDLLLPGVIRTTGTAGAVVLSDTDGKVVYSTAALEESIPASVGCSGFWKGLVITTLTAGVVLDIFLE